MTRFGRRTEREYPFDKLDVDLLWRAADATTAAGVTETIPSCRGSVTASRVGTGQAPKAASTNFPNAPQSITFAAGLGVYNATLATPPVYTIASVIRVTTTNSAIHAFTVGGTVNTGTASGHTSPNAFTKQGVTPTVLKAVAALPTKIILVGQFDASNIRVWANSHTLASSAASGALAGDTFTIGALDSAGTFPMKGEWVTTGLWNRALSQAEISDLLIRLGSLYNVPISA